MMLFRLENFGNLPSVAVYHQNDHTWVPLRNLFHHEIYTLQEESISAAAISILDILGEDKKWIRDQIKDKLKSYKPQFPESDALARVFSFPT